MKKIIFAAVLLFSAVVSAGVKEFEYTRSDMRRITRLVVRILSYNHYHQLTLDRNFSNKLFDECVNSLDPDRLYFTAEDVAAFKSFRNELHRQLLRGNFDFGIKLYELYTKRYSEYYDYAEKLLLSGNIKYDTDEMWQIDRKMLSRPSDRKSQLELWRKKVTNDALAHRLAERRMERKDVAEKNADPSSEKSAFKWELRTPEEKLLSRMRDIRNVIRKKRPIDVLGFYLDAIAGLFGSHSGYMAPALSEDFDINMSLSLSGIGATLSSEDGFIKVVSVVKGGPAALSGKLKTEDRIISATQNDGSTASLLDIPVGQAVQYIRGPRGTDVLLGVLSGNESTWGIPVDGAAHLLKLISCSSGARDISHIIPRWRGKMLFKCFAIRRDKVKLDEFGAKGSVRKIKDVNGIERKVGIIDLPSFYMDFAAVRRGEPDARRGSEDVRKILLDFRNNGVESVVVDLRHNGGGSLPDAVVLAGLFLKKGTVVQVRNSEGSVEKLDDPDESSLYDGPMVVLTSKFSASASEIFAGAMRDHQRAVLVGDSRTFGKGTVLTVEDLTGHMELSGKSVPAGSTTFEIAMFFRAAGGSVQQLGIASDIILPTLSQEIKVGEMFLDNHLPWSAIAPAGVVIHDRKIDGHIKKLSSISAQRIKKDPDYVKYMHMLSAYRKYRDKKQNSLNEKLRYQEYLSEVELSKEAERLSNAGENGGRSNSHDVVLDEAARIAADYVHLFDADKK